MELVTGPREPSEAQAFKAMMGLEMGEAHLKLLSLIARFEERLRRHLATYQVAGDHIDITHDPTRKQVRAASRFKRATTTLEQ